MKNNKYYFIYKNLILVNISKDVYQIINTYMLYHKLVLLIFNNKTTLHIICITNAYYKTLSTVVYVSTVTLVQSFHKKTKIMPPRKGKSEKKRPKKKKREPKREGVSPM